VKRSDLGDEAVQILISLNHALAIPSIAHDIAATMLWILLNSCYGLIAVN
jgi:hypothetical protein